METQTLLLLICFIKDPEVHHLLQSCHVQHLFPPFLEHHTRQNAAGTRGGGADGCGPTRSRRLRPADLRLCFEILLPPESRLLTPPSRPFGQTHGCVAFTRAAFKVHDPRESEAQCTMGAPMMMRRPGTGSADGAERAEVIKLTAEHELPGWKEPRGRQELDRRRRHSVGYRTKTCCSATQRSAAPTFRQMFGCTQRIRVCPLLLKKSFLHKSSDTRPGRN